MFCFFLFFLVSGFCAILYELVWLRLAMAQFGVTTALVSVVLSMFMAGLGVGSWAAGALIKRFETRPTFPPLRLYALCELLIGISALLVLLQLLLGHRIIEWLSGQNGISSGAFYLVAGAWLALTLIPLVRLYGSYYPAGHVCHPQGFPIRIAAVVQFSLCGKSSGSRRRCASSTSVH